MSEPAAEEEEVETIDPKVLKPDLYEAAKKNDTERVLRLLADRVPPTFVDLSSGWTPLHWAAKHGNLQMLRKLLENGASEPYHRCVLKSKSGDSPRGSLAQTQLKSETQRQLTEGETEGVTTENKEGDDEGSPGDENESPDTNGADPLLGDVLDGDDDEDPEKALETSVDLTKNTPLLWASFKGFVRIVWALLIDGYSPNDLDSMGNNALHLAAVNGHIDALKVLIEDGGRANVVNHYKNLPLDMATNKEIRELITVAMEKGASMTAADIALKHELNTKTFLRHAEILNSAIAEARTADSPKAPRTVASINEAIHRLTDAIADAKEWAQDEIKISEAEALVLKLDVTQELINDISGLRQCLPVRTQSTYVRYAHTLEKTLKRAENVNVDPSMIQEARDLLNRCQAEYWVCTMTARLKDVECAMDPNEHDMNRLKQAIEKAEGHHAAPEIIEEAATLHRRLDAELGMSRAMLGVPTVKLPMENPPEGYWEERDVGKIRETEEYPLPPAETGEYIWDHSESYTALFHAIEQLKKSYVGADTLGANPTVIAAAKEKLTKAEKEMKLLDAKDVADKAVALEAVAKLAKKLKKGKGKKK